MIESQVTDTLRESLLHYLGRLLGFSCLWMIAVIAVAFASQVIASDPNFVPLWFAAFSPISYVVGLVVSAPISIVVGSLTWVLCGARGGSPRSAAIASTLGVWFTVVAIAATARPYDDRTIAESVMTLGISVVLFAAFMPIPRSAPQSSAGDAQA